MTLLLPRAMLNVAEFALYLVRVANPLQYGPGLIHVPAADKPSWAVRNEYQANSKCGRRNDRHGKHPAPRLGASECVVDEIRDDDAAGEGDLV